MDSSRLQKVVCPNLLPNAVTRCHGSRSGAYAAQPVARESRFAELPPSVTVNARVRVRMNGPGDTVAVAVNPKSVSTVARTERWRCRGRPRILRDVHAVNRCHNRRHGIACQ